MINNKKVKRQSPSLPFLKVPLNEGANESPEKDKKVSSRLRSMLAPISTRTPTFRSIRYVISSGQHSEVKLFRLKSFTIEQIQNRLVLPQIPIRK